MSKHIPAAKTIDTHYRELLRDAGFPIKCSVVQHVQVRTLLPRLTSPDEMKANRDRVLLAESLLMQQHPEVAFQFHCVVTGE